MFSMGAGGSSVGALNLEKFRNKVVVEIIVVPDAEKEIADHEG